MVSSGCFQGWRYCAEPSVSHWDKVGSCKDDFAAAGRSHGAPYFAHGELSPSILAGISGSAPNQKLYLPPNSICHPWCVCCSLPFSLSAASSPPRWMRVCLFPAAHSSFSLLCICSAANIASFSLSLSLSLSAWSRDDMAVGKLWAPSLSPSLLLLPWLHSSKAQYSGVLQPVCLIAFHFQDASLLAQTQKFIHQMIGVRPIKCYCGVSSGTCFCTSL